MPSPCGYDAGPKALFCPYACIFYMLLYGCTSCTELIPYIVRTTRISFIFFIFFRLFSTPDSGKPVMHLTRPLVQAQRGSSDVQVTPIFF